MKSYLKEIQNKNIAWFLPRPKPDHYKGGMPLHCEEWLIDLAKDLLCPGPWENDGIGSRELKLLNLFCGMNKLGTRVDLNPEVKPDYLCDVHKLSYYLNIKFKYDIILADPPYSNEESKELYGTGKINYKKWTTECDKFLIPNGLLMIYHKYIMPNPFPDRYNIIKRVFIGNRTYHTPRVCLIFKKMK